jgi:hypothetical protein
VATPPNSCPSTLANHLLDRLLGEDAPSMRIFMFASRIEPSAVEQGDIEPSALIVIFEMEPIRLVEEI